MVNVPYRWISVILLACAGLTAARNPPPLSPRDIKPGMKGIGRTVFNGAKVEGFQAEILILENAGPKQSIILARLSGGPSPTPASCRA